MFKHDSFVGNTATKQSVLYIIRCRNTLDDSDKLIKGEVPNL